MADRSPPTASSTPDASASRSATASSPQQLRSFSVAASTVSSSVMPAATFTISAIGPVGDALAVRQAAPGQDRRALDAVDELAREARLADPGGAEDRDEVHPAVAYRPGERVVQQLELLLAPDERHGDVRVVAPRRRRRRRPATPPPLGEAACLLRAERLVTTEPRVSRSTFGPSRISPGSAACCRRAAALIARPVAKVVSVSSERISPDSIPIRTSSPSLSTAVDDPERGPHRRSGSSSCANGTPNAAMTASPANFWTIPPWVVMQWETWSKNRVRRERTTSGSALATSCVEPTRSTKSTVASFRSIPEG